jgi:hypothetical protein
MIQIKKSHFGKSSPFLAITLAVTLIFSALAWAQPDKKSGLLVGGPCKYKSYPGYATILSITRSSAGDQDKVRRFEVKFSFSPKNKITETFAQVEGKTFNLYGNNFQYPDREFLTSKYTSRQSVGRQPSGHYFGNMHSTAISTQSVLFF